MAPTVEQTAELPIGTRVVIDAPRRPRAVVYLKIDLDQWSIERSPRTPANSDRQVQWWLDHAPHKTSIEAPIGIDLWGGA